MLRYCFTSMPLVAALMLSPLAHFRAIAQEEPVTDIYATEAAWQAAVKSPKLLKTPAFAYVATDRALPRVLIYGDSISIGYTADVRKELAGKACVQRIPCNGGDTASGFDKLKQVGLEPGKWDVIHFNWGLHDLKYVRTGENGKVVLDTEQGKQVCSVEDYVANMRKLIALMKTSGAKLIWATTTPVPEGSAGRIPGDAKRYNDAVASLMREEGVLVDDLYALVAPKLAEWQRPANVHFLPEGSAAMGKQAAAKILEALAKQ